MNYMVSNGFIIKLHYVSFYLTQIVDGLIIDNGVDILIIMYKCVNMHIKLQQQSLFLYHARFKNVMTDTLQLVKGDLYHKVRTLCNSYHKII